MFLPTVSTLRQPGSNRGRGRAGITLTEILIAILILYAIREGRPFYLDAALVLAALSFISTTAAARYQAEGRPF